MANLTAWGPMEEEEEEDITLPLPEDFIAASPNSKVRFHRNRIVVRYPSEQSLLQEPEEPTIIIDDDDFSEEDSGEFVENGKEDVVKEPQEPLKKEDENTTKQEQPAVAEPPNGTATTPHVEIPNGANKSSEVSNSAPQPQERKPFWAQRVVVQRYTPKFAPPPPQPVEADNGEDEDEEDGEEEEEKEESSEEEEEEGYDSVVEDEDAEDDDTIKKIAEETITTRHQRLQSLQIHPLPLPQQTQPPQPPQTQQPPQVQQPPQIQAQQDSPTLKARGQDDMLRAISQIKDQLRDEVEKAEHASKAAAAAAQQAVENNMQLSSRVASMRSFLAVLCGGC